MRRTSGLSSRMSGYQYPAKKNTWKWTPAKIIAFSLFGLIMAALVYFESTSGQAAYEKPNPVSEEPVSVAESDFDEEYQEFLKKGKKIVTEETLDSINRVRADALNEADQTDDGVGVSLNESPGRKGPIDRQTASSAQASSTNTPDENDAGSLQSAELTTSSRNNTPSSPSTNQKITGNLIEVSPEEEENHTAPVQTPSEQPKEPITEEFYTEETISGTIAAASDGTPIPGVTITVKGTNYRSVSDSNGKYSITVPGDPLNRTITYSYRGNTTERDVAPGTETLNVRF